MNAIDFTQNFGTATSLNTLAANKRAKLGPVKKTAIGETYDGFLKTIAVPAESKPAAPDYKGILTSHGMTSYFPFIGKSDATGAKKLRVGEVVTTAATKFSDAVSIEFKEAVEEKKEEPVKPAVPETPAPAPAEEMTRTRRHEETNYEEESQPAVHQEPTTPVVDEASNRRLDSYLSNGTTHSPTIEEQKIDKLAKKLSEIDAVTRKTSDLKTQEQSLLAQEQEMDAKINAALRKADEDFNSATQSLDEVVEKVNETQERIRRKQELLDRLTSSKLM